jgi:hypothetical protein
MSDNDVVQAWIEDLGVGNDRQEPVEESESNKDA